MCVRRDPDPTGSSGTRKGLEYNEGRGFLLSPPRRSVSNGFPRKCWEMLKRYSETLSLFFQSKLWKQLLFPETCGMVSTSATQKWSERFCAMR